MILANRPFSRSYAAWADGFQSSAGGTNEATSAGHEVVEFPWVPATGGLVHVTVVFVCSFRRTDLFYLHGPINPKPSDTGSPEP